MAIGWLTILQTVPWTEVIANAPKVAEGAKKLWNTVAKKPGLPEPAVASQPAASPPDRQALDALEARTASLEAALSDLHAQMFASSELIKALADQNTQLVKRVEANRVRVLWLTVVTVALAITALAAWLR